MIYLLIEEKKKKKKEKQFASLITSLTDFQ